jgi:hypothetical protein
MVSTRVPSWQDLRLWFGGGGCAHASGMTTRRTHRTLVLLDEPSEVIELDPYLVDDTTITLDEWRHQDAEDAEVVRFHQPHGGLLVA